MTPRRTGYRPPRPRREVVIAVAASVGLTVLTGVLVWAVGPHASGTPSTPTLTAPPTVATTAPSAPASSTPSSPPAS